mgnify:CR=1 FL=1
MSFTDSSDEKSDMSSHDFNNELGGDNDSYLTNEPEPAIQKKSSKKKASKKTKKSKRTSKKTTKPSLDEDDVEDEPCVGIGSSINNEMGVYYTTLDKLINDLSTAEKKVIMIRNEIEKYKMLIQGKYHGIEIQKKYAHREIQSQLKNVWGRNNLNKDTTPIKKEKQLQYIESRALQEFLKEETELEKDDNIDIIVTVGHIKSYLEDKGLKDNNNKYSLDDVIKDILFT